MNTTEIKQEIKVIRKSRTAKSKRTAVELLNDPSIVTVSVSQAAMILDISKQTALKTLHETGYLLR